MSESYVTQKQLEETLAKNNKELSKVIIDAISETLRDMMDGFDRRFTKIENDIQDIKEDIADLKKSQDRLLNTIDGFIKRLEGYGSAGCAV